MLDLTVKYADAWNTAWFGVVEGSAEKRAEMDAALAAAGRDRATMTVTVGVNVATAAEAAAAETPLDPHRVLTGTPAEIAAAFQAYEAAGVDHLICGALSHTTYDYTTEVMALVTEALSLYRNAE
jgi:alkanesulfonate monooxygenase SsuD/methylene tetrahydromethanopterin reductase-like flavin-dependent oxidoreductase (luciferase family)